MLGICLVGAGRAGMIHARNYVSGIPGVKLSAIVDSQMEVAQKAAEELGISYYSTDYREAFQKDDVDAVVVVTPTKYHADVVVEAANAGKHIFCEKPMAMNINECEKMIQAAKENGVKLQIGFMRRFDKNFCRAKQLIEEGEIGEVVTVTSMTHGPSKPKEWMYDIDKSNGPLAEVNSHDIDTARWLTGGEVESLYAIAGNFRCREAAENYPTFYDTVMMNMRMTNGCIVNIDGAQGVQYGYDARVNIVGTKGCIQVGDLKDGTVLSYTKNGVKGDIVESWMNLFLDAYRNEDISFVNSILNDTETEVSGWDGMKAVEVVRAGNQSIQTGRVISLQSNKQQ